MSKLDKDQVIAAFTEAYTKANGKAPSIEAKGGWYSVDGAKNVRLAELNEQISQMGGSSAASTTQQAPKAAPTKTATKPKSTTTNKKTKNTHFSVKAFWAAKLQNSDMDSKLPR